jgi:hypothetical protein
VTKELLIYFAANPDAQLSSRQIADRFHVECVEVSSNLRTQIAAGYLVVAKRGKTRSPAIYAAGPRLLKARV